MKLTLFIALLLSTVCGFGQYSPAKVPAFGSAQSLSGKVAGLRISNQTEKAENDTIIKVVYIDGVDDSRKPAYFIDGSFADESILKTLNPNEIEKIDVENGDFEIENVKYYGKLYIVTKPTYKPKLISLNALKSKYANLKGGSTIFEINDEIIHADYDQFLVDENFVFKIKVEIFENKSEKLNINFVNVVTKTPENIEKSKEIRLRGNGEVAIKVSRLH